MQTLSKRKSGYVAMASFGFTALFIIATYILSDIAPLGNHSVLRLDLFNQYAPYLIELTDKIRSILSGSPISSLLYSFKAGGGVSFIANFFNYLSSPFNIIVILFGKENIELSIALIILLKTSLASALTAFVLNRTTNAQPIYAVILGMLYSTSSWFLAFGWNIMWLDAVYMLPLVFYGLYLMVYRDRCGLYIFALTYTIITNYYMGFMICIASVIFYLYFLISFPESASRTYSYKHPLIRSISKFTASSALCGILSSGVLYVMYNALTKTATLGDSLRGSVLKLDPLRFLSGLLSFNQGQWQSSLPSIRYTVPNIACGALVLILLPTFFFNKLIPKKERIMSAITIGVFYASFAVSYLDFVWNAFHIPRDLPYRYSFVFVLFLVFLASRTVGKFEGIKSRTFLFSTVCVFVLSTVIGICCPDNLLPGSFWVTPVLVMIYYAIIDKKGTGRHAALSCLLCVIVMAEVAIPYASPVVAPAGYLLQYGKDVEELVEVAENDEEGWGRVEMLETASMNDPLVYSYHGVSGFSSLNYKAASYIQKALGIKSNGVNHYIYRSQTPMYDFIMGIQYLLNTAPKGTFCEADDFRTIVKKTGNGYDILKNRFIAGFGYGANALPDEDVKFDTENPFENQKAILDYISGVDGSYITYLMQREIKNNGLSLKEERSSGKETTYSATKERDDGTATVTAYADKTAHYYAYVSSDYMTVEYIAGQTHLLQNSKADDTYIADLGVLNAGEPISITLSPSTRFVDSSERFSMSICYIEEESVKSAITTAQTNGILRAIKDEGNRLECEIDCRTKYIFTSIPYDENMNVYVDGVAVASKKIFDAFIGLDVCPGKHKIVFEYSLF